MLVQDPLSHVTELGPRRHVSPLVARHGLDAAYFVSDSRRVRHSVEFDATGHTPEELSSSGA